MMPPPLSKFMPQFYGSQPPQQADGNKISTNAGGRSNAKKTPRKSQAKTIITIYCIVVKYQ
jgi:hypothetical protein